MELRRLRGQAHNRHSAGTRGLERVARRLSTWRITRQHHRSRRQAASPSALGIRKRGAVLTRPIRCRSRGAMDRIAGRRCATFRAWSGIAQHLGVRVRAPDYPGHCIVEWPCESIIEPLGGSLFSCGSALWTSAAAGSIPNAARNAIAARPSIAMVDEVPALAASQPFAPGMPMVNAVVRDGVRNVAAQHAKRQCTGTPAIQHPPGG